MTALDVVIVSYRSRDRLRDCLLSLREQPPSRPANVLVVDNDSHDGTVELVRSEFPEVSLVEAGANLGFARATNVGIRRGNAEFVLALNPDTVLQEGTLDVLLELMDAHPEVGVAGPKLVREDGTLDHAAKRAFPTIGGALGHFLLVGRKRESGRLAQYRAPGVESGPVDAVNGAFMLIRRRALEEVGLFDEGYWMYMEDLDLCYRFAAAGWRTWYEPAAETLHVKAASSGRARAPRLNYAFHYGMARFYRTHYAPGRSLLVNATVYGGIALKLCASLVVSAVSRRVAGPRQPGSGAGGARNFRYRRDA